MARTSTDSPNRWRRVALVAVVVAGVAAVPLTGFSTERIDWQRFADAYDAVTPD